MTEQEIAAKEKQQVPGQEKTRAAVSSARRRYRRVRRLDSLRADMPGVKEEHVEDAQGGRSRPIIGTVSTEAYEKLSPLYTEYNVGNYFRQFELNEDVDDKHIGFMRNGVLKLRFPRASARRLAGFEVRTGSVQRRNLSIDGVEGPVCHSWRGAWRAAFRGSSVTFKLCRAPSTSATTRM